MVKVIIALLWLVSISNGQRITLENQTRSRIAALTPPATCTAGYLYINTLGNLYVCTSTNTWVSRTITPIMTQATISGVNGTDRILYYQTSGVNRWLVYVNSTPESGANAGSDFAIQSYDDSGDLLTVPIAIARASGIVTIAAGINSPALPVHADNAAAISAGLIAGRFYRTSAGVVMVVF